MQAGKNLVLWERMGRPRESMLARPAFLRCITANLFLQRRRRRGRRRLKEIARRARRCHPIRKTQHPMGGRSWFRYGQGGAQGGCHIAYQIPTPIYWQEATVERHITVRATWYR